MAVIRYTKDATIRYAYLNIFPDQFKTEKEKQDPSWIKNTMDYFATKAYSDYVKNRDTFVRNYDLIKGILRKEDFYEEPEVKSFTQMLTKDLDLPSYVKHYSILTTPINNLVGELSRRPDGYKIKAFDEDSKSEELAFKTEILQQFVLQQAKQDIINKLAQEGEEISDEEANKLAFEQVKDDIDNYTSVAEKWANHVLTAMKAEFNTKELSEEGMRDLLISNHEYFHIYEDNSKLGFNLVEENPKNVWYLTTPDVKYTSDPSGRAQGAYAGGTVKVMEISQIIESIPDLTKEEIDHLRSSLEDYGLINVRESNLGNPGATPGIDSIKYDTFDPLVLEERMILESEMKENTDNLKDFLGLTSNVSAFGYKYVVVTAYWISKKKIGKVTYKDKLDNIQTTLVDENYKSGDIPTQISIEWGWINQWYQGRKIGPDIYHVKPLRILNYMPIFGLNFEIKNTEARSLVDLMKPFQVIYNVCMNQLFDLLKKEIGNVGAINLRRIPRIKDGDAQDDIDMWEMEARQRGIIFDDDSPENTKAPVTNTSVAKNVDLTRTNEIQSRYNLAIQIKNECYELIGMNRQRLGSTLATQTATNAQNDLQQSFAQTEPVFVAHEYLLGQVYQAIVDACQYIESQKENSTISYITPEGESAFIKVNGTDISLRDLKVYPTNRPEDRKLFEEIRQLAQPLLQNGGSFHEVIELYSTNSIRQMKKVFKSLKDRQEELQNSQIQQGQQQLEQNEQIAAAQLEQERQIEENRIANENYQKEKDRLSKEKIAIIQSLGFGKVQGEDLDNDAVYDVLELDKLEQAKEKNAKDYELKLMDLQSKNKQADEKLEIEREKIKVTRENMANDLKIAKENAKGRKKANSSSKKKK